MEDLSSPTDYDGITSNDLFNSFMDVALSAETYINDYSKSLSQNDTEFVANNDLLKLELQDINRTTGHKDNFDTVTQPLPLLVKTSEPVYETCGSNSKFDESIQNTSKNSSVESSRHNGTIIKNVNIEYAVNKEGDISQQEIHSNENFQQYTLKGSEPNVADLYATPDKTKSAQNNITHIHETATETENHIEKNNYDETFPQYSVNKPQLNNMSDLYATPDKSNVQNDMKPPTVYTDVTIVNANKQNHQQIGDKSNYTEVVIGDAKEIKPPSSEYEVISNYQKPLNDSSKKKVKNGPSNISLGVAKSTDVLNAEQIAFGPQRAHSQSQKEMYSTIATTIERGNTQLSPRSASTNNKEKRNFFGFGKKHSSVESPTRTHSDSTQRWSAELNNESTGHQSPGLKRQSSIPVICSGFMFKQGGTGFTPKNWRLRWFELKSDNCLYYYKSEQDQMANGAVMLLKYSVTRAVEVNKRFAFKLVKGGARTYYFAANSEEEMRKWMKNLGEAAKNAVSDHTSIPECSLKNVSIPALSITEPDCHGFLYKQGNSHKSWKKRYCVLKYGCLFYYEDMSNEVAIGVFKLQHYTIAKTPNAKYSFDATPPLRKMRTYHFYSESEIDFKRWVEAMKHSVASCK